MIIINNSFVHYVSLLILCTISAAGNAEMYKWVDEDGNTQYTQQPPPDGIKAETLGPPPKVDTDQALEELEQNQDKLQKIQEEREKQKTEQAKQAELDTLYKENCRKAQARLNSLQNSGRIRAVDEQGNVTRATVEEHQARIDEVKEKIKKYCK